jgi:hypothetical protein
VVRPGEVSPITLLPAQWKAHPHIRTRVYRHVPDTKLSFVVTFRSESERANFLREQRRVIAAAEQSGVEKILAG